MEKVIKTLKSEVKRELETVRGQQAIARLVSDTSEDWESEEEDHRQGDKERPLTPVRREV